MPSLSRPRGLVAVAVALAACCFLAAPPVRADVFDVSVLGGDVIFLAGRTDVVIPPAADPWIGPGTHIIRHGGPTPEEVQETTPSAIPVTPGSLVRLNAPAEGGVSYFNGVNPIFGPAGNGLAGSDLNALDGISGYKGPQGPLVGVFLGPDVPSAGPAPATLDFTPAGLGIGFTSLSPELGQVFYIGDGFHGGVARTFVAPDGATRLFLGIADGFGFHGDPGAYDDNDGAFRATLSVTQAPEPGSLALGLMAATGGLLAFRRRRRCCSRRSPEAGSV